MARNSEKAQAMLNKFVQMKKDQAKGPVQLRPFIASEVTNLGECEKWRSQVIREISKEVSIIQNGSLGEHKIRELNDHINKLLREKRHWERQIKLLGGPDYELTAPKIVDSDGRRALGTEGYFYFGAAKELPGVRELFDKVVVEPKKRTRGELHKIIDADYYGYKDDDDGILVRLEAVAERKAIETEVKAYAERNADAFREWKRSRVLAIKEKKNGSSGDAAAADDDGEEDPLFVDEEQKAEYRATKQHFKAHVPLPSREEIEKEVLAKKKQELLSKFGAGAAGAAAGQEPAAAAGESASASTRKA